MIRFHGGPITPESAALRAWRCSHAMISFANPEQVDLAFAIADSVVLDNGAWPIFVAGKGKVDVEAYLAFIQQWQQHPAFAWCLIPDVIEGTERQNDRHVDDWPLSGALSVPVWHMHESMDRLAVLIAAFPRVAIGSSGDFVDIGTPRWWARIAEAMEVVCDDEGRPKKKLHGLRQMDPTIFSAIPYASVDSTNVARNIGIDSNWTGSYVPQRKETRAIVLRDNIANHPSADRWQGIGGIQRNLELFG